MQKAMGSCNFIMRIIIIGDCGGGQAASSDKS